MNGLVVNLEVVRSRLARSGDDAGLLSFAEQAAAQAEESVKLNEAVGSLLSLLAGSIDENGGLRCTVAGGSSSGIRFEVDRSTADRVMPGLQTLSKAVGFAVETRDGAVILSFPETSLPESRTRE